ncbi:unnamed protein product [Lupinus luteus]|uniref:Protein kinase domain-containing protein n=1 Tax=Lupinus luteus TaxID=3873 RepID=A0AAV1YF42_LUPLU
MELSRGHNIGHGSSATVYIAASCHSTATTFTAVKSSEIPHSEHLQSRHGRINEPVIALYTTQFVQGLECLHSKGLVHCDIKGSNILVQTSLENYAAGRIKGLALSSRDPNWTWDDENWIATIGNNNEIVARAEASKTRNYCMVHDHSVLTNNNITLNNCGYMLSCY